MAKPERKGVFRRAWVRQAKETAPETLNFQGG